jgi:hypothetical protein
MHEAEYEMPALVPDLNKMEVQSDHEQSVAESPAYATLSHQLDQLLPSQDGISVVNASQVEANQIMTGIKDNNKKAAEVQSVRESDPLALPKDLAGAKPRYRTNKLQFDDPRDLALYTVARDFTKSESDNPNSSRHADYLSYIKRVAPELKSPEIIEGRQVRARIKELSKGVEEGATIRVPRSDFLTEAKAKTTTISGEGFAQHRVDTIAYFKNPSSNSQKLASDGTIIGGRDKRTWNQRLKAENFDQFIDTLKQADGNRIQFENPYQIEIHFRSLYGINYCVR